MDPAQRYILGCFIFSPFLNFKMPGVPIGGISGKKFAPQFFFDYDVILRWSTTFEISGGQKSHGMAISPEPLIVGRQNWCQNARKNRFPIRDVEQPILHQFQKKSYFKKTKFVVSTQNYRVAYAALFCCL